jgi:hypothetical protein
MPGTVSAATAAKGVRPGVTAQSSCAGHSCDGCRTCGRGTCCRRDLPVYQLPEFGSWSSPIFGRLRVLTWGELGAECDICGAAFHMLATHVWKAHGLWADEYRLVSRRRAPNGFQATPEIATRFGQRVSLSNVEQRSKGYVS